MIQYPAGRRPKAVVTGSAGFLGGHFVQLLQARGWDVHPLDLQDPIAPLDARMLFLGPFETERYDLVVHAAAQAPHRAAIDGQPRGFAYNVALDSMMFDWAARTRQGHVIYFSSSAVYPVGFQRGEPAYRLGEDDALECRVSSALLQQIDMVDLEPDGRYGHTKAIGERLAGAAREVGVPVTVVRPFSGYGSDQSTDFPFGAFLARAMQRESPFQLWNPDAVRDWIHVDDVVAGAMELADRDVTDPVNLCTGRPVSTKELALMLCGYAGYDTPLEFETVSGAPQGVRYRVGQPDRLHKYYIPQTTLEAGAWRAVEDWKRRFGRGQ